jgi:hypothetical protein
MEPFACFRLRFWVGFFRLLVTLYSVRPCFLLRHVFFFSLCCAWCRAHVSIFQSICVLLSLPVRNSVGFVWENLVKRSLLSEILEDGRVSNPVWILVDYSVCINLVYYPTKIFWHWEPSPYSVNVLEISLMFLYTTGYLSVCYISFVGRGHFVVAVQSWTHWIICWYERKVLRLVRLSTVAYYPRLERSVLFILYVLL